jgi:hypothetical protein
MYTNFLVKIEQNKSDVLVEDLPKFMLVSRCARDQFCFCDTQRISKCHLII